MKFKNLLFAFNIIFLFSIVNPAQTPTAKKQTATAASQAARATPAFAEILLRRTELESILEDLLIAYTDDFPKVKETRYELSLIEKDSAKLEAAGANTASLSPALGKLMVRRAALATDLWSLQNRFGSEHPDVKRAARRAAIFDKAVGEIFP